MKLPILTPEATLYAETTIAVYSVSCGWLTGWIYARWQLTRRVAFLPLYVGVMAAVAASALVVLDVPIVTSTSWSVVAISLPVGIAAGSIARRAGSALKRLWQEKARRSERPARARWRAGDVVLAHDGAGASLASARPLVAMDMPRATSVSRRVQGLWILAGILEEVLFRGVLVDLAFGLPAWPLTVLVLMAGVAAFAFSHLTLGGSEVLDKLPLGIIALLAALAMRSVAPAVVAHAFFNWRVGREIVSRGEAEIITGGGITMPRTVR